MASSLTAIQTRIYVCIYKHTYNYEHRAYGFYNFLFPALRFSLRLIVISKALRWALFSYYLKLCVLSHLTSLLTLIWCVWVCECTHRNPQTNEFCTEINGIDDQNYSAVLLFPIFYVKSIVVYARLCVEHKVDWARRKCRVKKSGNEWNWKEENKLFSTGSDSKYLCCSAELNWRT